MEIYLVGGAIRNQLLGLPVTEQDWVVVGATPAQMTERGFRQVGKDFPVFLHPETHEEYALARTERKTAPGYAGFEVHAAPDVTLEEDLQRRDLTINAMARDESGKLVDPYGGRQDLENRILRHVSDAFSEDPVRVLRVARFAAALAAFEFSIAPKTLALMSVMVDNGEIDALVPERVWQETEQALKTDHPDVFFGVLRECGALKSVFPELEALYGVPQPKQWHPEIDTGVHTMMVLQQATRLSASSRVRFAALTHDLGKAETPSEKWPSHPGHEEKSVRLVKEMCARLRIANDYRRLAINVARFHGHCHRARELRPGTMLKVLERLDVFRNPDRLQPFLLACEADSRGRTGLENEPYPQARLFRRAYEAAASVKPSDTERNELTGAEIGKRLHQQRVKAIAAALKEK